MEINKPSIVSIASLRLRELLDTMIVDLKSTSITNDEGASSSGSRGITNHIYLAVTDGPHPAYFTSVSMMMSLRLRLIVVMSNLICCGVA